MCSKEEAIVEAAMESWSAKQRASEVRKSAKSTRDDRLNAEADVVHFANRVRELTGHAESKLEVDQTERETLVSIFEATGGYGWHRRGGWVGRAGTRRQRAVPYFAIQPRFWEGVGMVGGSVEALELAKNNLVGNFPSIDALKRLRTCRLDYNDLEGIGNKMPASLVELSCAANQLRGTLDFATRLPALRKLDLSRNRLSGPLPELSGVERIDVSGNLLDGRVILSPSVVTVLVADNRLTGRLECSQCARLTLLDASQNGITAFSQHLPAALVELRANHNKLACTLDALLPCRRTALRVLLLQANRICGTLPADIAERLPEIQDLNLSSNDIDGILPSSLARLRHLRCLDLSSNPKLDAGPYPAGLENLDLLDFAAAAGPPSATLGRERNFDASRFKMAMAFQRLYVPSDRRREKEEEQQEDGVNDNNPALERANGRLVARLGRARDLCFDSRTCAAFLK
ncbi:hypothetical protein CTAYLR_004059 [Chrysophaeum taylorii]|uniref:Uncharacterized protein n=1 Tax=Chrysophaeum taylorii TaxID=2483200 RepID=A0AAD7XTZ3_9STRA|nr:hypothetical protein CTAYLR_004059 [Chrysophaeum taylorii]